MPEDPRDFLNNRVQISTAPDRRFKRLEQTKHQRDAQLVLETMHEGKPRVFFYPGAGHDWEPLHRLTHLCDTFIFCDFGVAAASVAGDFGLPGLRTDSIVPLDADTVTYLSDPTSVPDNIRHNLEGGQRTPAAQPWGKYARLTRTVGNIERRIDFFYLGMESVTAFFHLFIPESTAPKVICQPLSIGDFFHWDGPLAQIVRMCETRPKFLVSNRRTPPYTEHWQRFGNWFSSWVAQDYQPESVQAKPLGGDRQVIVKRGHLTPESVADYEAIVLTVGRYTGYQQQWPVGASILLLAPSDQAGQLHGHPDNVVFLGQRYAPLGDVLERIPETCAELAVTRVASVFIGYEDEGPVLDQWRQQSGMRLELTIYCEEEGDVASFGPYADKIHEGP